MALKFPCLGPQNAFWVEFAPFNSSFCFLQRCTFGSATPNFHVMVQLLLSSSRLITINLKLAP
jgi:hypothetical protein